MVQGVTLANKGLAPSRLINYITVVKKTPMMGTPTVYNLLLASSLLTKVLADFLSVNYLLTLVLNHCKKSCTNTLCPIKENDDK